jgi:hypothetical protein
MPRPIANTLHIDRRAGQIIAQSGDANAQAEIHNADDMMSTKEVADWLGVSEQFLAIRRNQHNGPRFIRVSPRKIMYQRRDVLVWLERRKYASTQDYPRRSAAR